MVYREGADGEGVDAGIHDFDAADGEDPDGEGADGHGSEGDGTEGHGVHYGATYLYFVDRTLGWCHGLFLRGRVFGFALLRV